MQHIFYWWNLCIKRLIYFKMDMNKMSFLFQFMYSKKMFCIFKKLNYLWHFQVCVGMYNLDYVSKMKGITPLCRTDVFIGQMQYHVPHGLCLTILQILWLHFALPHLNSHRKFFITAPPNIDVNYSTFHVLCLSTAKFGIVKTNITQYARPSPPISFKE